MTSAETDYFRARALEERECAAAAADPAIRNIHLDLAAKYDDLVALTDERSFIGRSWNSFSKLQSA